MPHIKDAMGFPVEHTAPNVDQLNAASTAALNPTMGASATDMSQVNAGALTALPAYQQALAIANQVYTEREPMSPALLSLMYFSKLAEESSKPGATLLGAAGAAATTPAAYLAKERELKRADEKAKGTLAATLTSTLAKAPAKAIAYTLKNNPDEVVYYTPTEFAALTPTAKSNLRPFKEKDASTQKPARYLVNDADAVNAALGTNFADGDVESLTADDFNKVGRGALSVADKPSAGAFQERNLNYLVSNADAIKNGTADATQIAQYGVKYQQLAGGTERTETVDGVTRTIS